MQKSSIQIDILLDPQKLPEQINWSASDSRAQEHQRAKAMFLAFWDGAEKTAMRIDLWTKEMMVDEMADFYYQMMMSMADTFERATRMNDLSSDMKEFAKTFHQKFRQQQLEQNKQ